MSRHPAGQLSPPRRSALGGARRLIACLVVVLAVIVLPGCARSVVGTPVAESSRSPSSANPKKRPAHPAKDYDINKLSTLQSEFPPGFNQVQVMPVATLGPAADKFSNIGIGDAVTIHPPNCRSLLQPVRPPRDGQFTMVSGIGRGAILVGAVKSPGPLPETTAPAGCDHAAVIRKLARRLYSSTVTRLAGPVIDGVTTTGSVDVADRTGTKSYVFAGFLSDRVAVAVQGLLPGDPHVEDILQGLLTRAVNAIREG